MSAINALQGHSPALIVVTFLLFSYLMPLFDRWKKEWCASLAILAHIIAILFTGYLTWEVMNNGPLTYHLGGWAPPWGIEFVVDYMAVFMLITISVVSLAILTFGTKDLTHELKDKVSAGYYTLYLLLVGSMLGLAITNDLFNMFVFMEIGGIAACGIIAAKSDRACIEASLKYLILGAVGTGCVLLSVALLYMVSGNLNMTFVGAALENVLHIYPNNILVALALFTVGFVVKSALFPLHVWLPDAHSSAPSPSSAILSGLVIKIYAVTYLKLLIRVFPTELFSVIPVYDVILILASMSIIFGSVFAIVQEDIKKMLAYSSIAQIGYVFLGIGLFNINGLSGGILHIFNHAMMKSMLFLSAGAIIYCTGFRKIKDLKGIGMKMPLVMVVFTIGALAMVGIPVTNGFISKLYLAIGTIEAGKPILLAVILASSLLNAVYYFPIIIGAFFGTHHDDEDEHEEVKCEKLPLKMQIPLIALGLGCIFFGLFPQVIMTIIEKAVYAMLL